MIIIWVNAIILSANFAEPFYFRTQCVSAFLNCLFNLFSAEHQCGPWIEQKYS